MKKNLTKLIILLTMTFSLLGCDKKEEPITNKDESTIIKDAKSTDEYLKKNDYKSIAYAYIYKIKEGITSYESETKGTIKSKVAFINYNIDYHSITYKNGSAFYSKDHSTSALMNIDNEFYMASKDKILVSRDLEKYDVYTLEDYKKVSYTPAQYTIMGYVFNDQSIIKSEVVSDKGDVIAIKYTLDNELATNIVKVDLKVNGGLNAYPVYKCIEMTLSMKRDFTPISYAIDAIYDASKPIIGSVEVKQHGECLFSKVNEKITIPNESYLAEQLGATPSAITYDDKEDTVKNELIDAAKNLDFAKGVNVNGNVTLNLLGTAINLKLDTDVTFDISKLSEEKLYNLFNIYAKLEGDENFSSLASLIKAFAKDKLGDFADLLDNFKSIEVSYDGNGQLYLVPTNSEGTHQTVFVAKLTDLVDILLKQINVYNLVNDANKDYFTFTKIPGNKEGDYKVELALTSDALIDIKEQINKFFENETYAMLKALLNYKDFDSIKITVEVTNNKVSSLDASVNYLKQGNDTTPDAVEALVTVHLDAKEQTFDFDAKLKEAQTLYTAYLTTAELRSRINELVKNVYVNKGYLANVNKAMEEYNALTDMQKNFFSKYAITELENTKNNVNGVLAFLDVYNKCDLNKLSTNDVYELAKAYRQNNVNSVLLKDEIGEDNFNKINDLASLINFDLFTKAATKMIGDDENAWGLTEEEIKEAKLIFDICDLDSGVTNRVLIIIYTSTGTFTLDLTPLKTKVNNLYNKLPNA